MDPGSNVTGWAVIEARGSRLSAVSHGALRSTGATSFEARILRMADALGAVIDSFSPAEAAMEDLFHSINTRSALQLAHLRGALVLELTRRGLPLSTYAPLAVKKAVTGAGRAEKAQVRVMVERLLRIDLGRAPLDVSDALAVAICHAHTRRVTRGGGR